METDTSKKEARQPSRARTTALKFVLLIALIGILYSVSLPVLIAFSLVVELAAIPLFLLVRRQFRPMTTGV